MNFPRCRYNDDHERKIDEVQFREKYLSRWSRENTPVDNEKRYASHVRRSYTPVRDIASSEVKFIPITIFMSLQIVARIYQALT